MLENIWEILSKFNGTGDIKGYLRSQLRGECDVIWNRYQPELAMIIPKGKIFGRYVISVETAEIVCWDFPESYLGDLPKGGGNYIRYPNGTFMRSFVYKDVTYYATSRSIIAPDESGKYISSTMHNYTRVLPGSAAGLTEFYVIYDPQSVNIVYYGPDPKIWKIATADDKGIDYLETYEAKDFSDALDQELCGIYIPSANILVHSPTYHQLHQYMGNMQNVDYAILKNLKDKTGFLIAYPHLKKRIEDIERGLEKQVSRIYRLYRGSYVQGYKLKYTIDRIICAKLHERYLIDKAGIDHDRASEIIRALDATILAELMEIDLRR